MKTSGAFTFFLSPLGSILSRKHEYEADRFAAEVMEKREPMIQGLVKLTRDNLSNLTPHPWYSFFYYSHPTVMERIRAEAIRFELATHEQETIPPSQRGRRPSDSSRGAA